MKTAHTEWTAAAAFAVASAMGFAQAGTRDPAFPGWFEALQGPACLTPGTSPVPVTNGAQYRDSDANGILPGRWFMLVRWQNQDATGVTSTAASTPYLGGRRLHFFDGTAGDAFANPGIRVDCYDVSIVLNTWTTPHRPIVGGGYNDMFGYAWGEDLAVRPFVRDGKPTDLMMQARAGLTTYWPTLPDATGASRDASRPVTKDAASAQLSFFAYVRDTTHPELAPIALLASVFDSELDRGSPPAGVAYDYDETMTETFRRAQPAWFAGDDSTSGVWFSAGPITRSERNRQPFVDTYFTEAETVTLDPLANEPNPQMPLYRAHFTAENMKAAVQEIRAAPCERETVICQARYYSLDPADYAISYAGVIAEVTLRNERAPTDWYDAGPEPGQWVPFDARRNQVVFGAHVREIGIYRGVPN